ncbi:hypothetical protein ACC690_39850, partial [Rhizobium johnstonii]
VMVQSASCLIVPHIAVRGRDQRLINASLCGVAVTALLGLLFAPLSTVWLWAATSGSRERSTIVVMAAEISPTWPMP